MKKHTKEVLKKRKNDLSIINFQDKFNTDDACREYLFKLKWSNSFECVNCGYKEYYFIKGRNLYQCTKCKKQHSIIAGTLFQDTHVDLRKWFWAIYLVSRDKRGLSAIGLKNAINVSYPTAWAMLNKIRQAMGSLKSDYLLKEIIIADNFFFKKFIKRKKA